MANSAKKLKAALTARARNNKICKARLLDWVMNQFRNGENPVIIRCTRFLKDTALVKHLLPMEDDWLHLTGTQCLNMVNGRYIWTPCLQNFYEEKRGKIEPIDVTNTDVACAYAVNGLDESDKRLFLESEGFQVWKRWLRGVGYVLEIRY